MFKKTFITLSAVAGLGFAASGFAHPPQCDDDESWQQCRDAQAAYIQRLNSDNSDLFHRTGDDRFSFNDSDSRYYQSADGDRYFRSADGDLYYRNPVDERYYLVNADDRYYQGAADSRYYNRASDSRYYRTSINGNSRSTKCVYFDQKDGRYYQKSCQ